MEQSSSLAVQALDIMNTPLTQATLFLTQGDISKGVRLVSEDAFEQGFLHLMIYHWSKQNEHLEIAKALLGSALRLY